jgi:hypothetical protein
MLQKIKAPPITTAPPTPTLIKTVVLASAFKGCMNSKNATTRKIDSPFIFMREFYLFSVSDANDYKR